MKRPHLLISGAWLVHAVAWFLPVVKGQELTLPKGLPGWEAFRVAFSVVWPYEEAHFDQWYFAVLSTASAITTLFFLFGSPWAWLRKSPSLQRTFAWVAAAAFVLNTHWLIDFGSDRSDLRPGYYLWWLSFGLLAAGLFALARQGSSSAVHSTQKSA